LSGGPFARQSADSLPDLLAAALAAAVSALLCHPLDAAAVRQQLRRPVWDPAGLAGVPGAKAGGMGCLCWLRDGGGHNCPGETSHISLVAFAHLHFYTQWLMFHIFFKPSIIHPMGTLTALPRPPVPACTARPPLPQGCTAAWGGGWPGRR